MKLSEVLRSRYAEIVDEQDALKTGRASPSTIPTGLREFDRRGGHKRKTIALYSGATGDGKSMWKLHLARAAALAGYSVTLVDLEDPKERTADRVFATETAINSAEFVGSLLDDQQMMDVGLALSEAGEWAERVELYEGVRTGEEALGLFEDHPADLEIFDYLSALPHGDHGREREVSDFMWGWTGHVQRHNVAGVGLAQTSGDVVERGLTRFENDRRWGKDDKKLPSINGFRAFDNNDLVWCRDAGRNAKELGFMLRPGRIYQRLGYPQVKDDVMEFSFPKRNWGAEGTIRVGIDLKTSRFFNLAETTDGKD